MISNQTSHIISEMLPKQTAIVNHLSWLQSSKVREFIFLFVLLMPVFFINVKDSHNWGGDFALYIHQAINIVEGKSQIETGYILNDQYFLPSPKTYPVGFPILLAPLYYVFGNSILAFSCFISSVLFLLGLVLYHFFRSHFSRTVSWCAILLIVYNPWTLSFKGEILADLPFMLFMILAVIFYLQLVPKRRTLPESLLLGFLTAFSMLLKSIGVVLLASLLADAIFQMGKKLIRGEKKALAHIALDLLVTTGSCLLFYSAISFILIPTAIEPMPYYQSLYDFRDLGNLALNVFKNYALQLKGFFYLTDGVWKILTLATIAIASILMAIGLVRKFLQNPGILEWLALAYSAVVLTFPTANQGLRYLFPILPIYIFFIISGARSCHLGGKVKANHLLILIAILCCVHYPSGIQKLLAEQGKTTIGPQERQSKEVFQYIKENTSKKAVFVFIKPTVLSLYAERNCMANRRDQDVAGMATKFEQVGVDYYLTNSDLANGALDRFLIKHKVKVRLIWSNEKFKLYKKII